MKTELAGVVGSNHGLLVILRQFWPAFCLGQVAPDVQGVAGLPRAATHFYEVPPAPDNMAYPRMMAQYPQLADVVHLHPAHAVFLAGYFAHLLLDLIWFREILIPYFWEPAQKGKFPQSRLLHHVLLTHLDKLAYESLPETAVSTLAAAQPDHWLPFATDQHLQTWRDMLLMQMQPDAPLETVQVYARRLGTPAADFAAKLADESWMADSFYALVPVQQVQARLDSAVTESIDLVGQYLQPILGGKS